MKLHVLSDLHLNHHADSGAEFIANLKPLADTLVIAGDLCDVRNLPLVAQKLSSKYKDVIYVLGNHEYYHYNKKEVTSICKNINIPNFHWLENSIVEIDGYRFLGTTLWFKHDNKNDNYRQFMNDFFLIKNFEKWVYKLNLESIKFLNDNLKENNIVITHHLPSTKCITPMFLNDPLNPFFVCDVSDLITEYNPKLWIFGHTHCQQDLTIGNTQLTCNPAGYPNEWVKYSPNLSKVIEV